MCCELYRKLAIWIVVGVFVLCMPVSVCKILYITMPFNFDAKVIFLGGF